MVPANRLKVHPDHLLLLAEGLINKAYQTLAGVNSLKIDNAKFEKLIQLHPVRTNPIEHYNPLSFQVKNQFTEQEVSFLLNDLDKLKSPGICGLRYDHLKQCIGKQSTIIEQTFLKHLTRFLTLISNAQLPEGFMIFLGVGHLIALPKPNNTPGDCRPITMGEVFRRIVSSLLLRQNQPTIDALMGDLQLGVGNKCGADKIIHLLSYYVTEGVGDTICIDFKNAFNGISRAQILAQVARHFPKLLPFVQSIYSGEPYLWFMNADPSPHVESI